MPMAAIFSSHKFTTRLKFICIGRWREIKQNLLSTIALYFVIFLLSLMGSFKNAIMSCYRKDTWSQYNYSFRVVRFSEVGLSKEIASIYVNDNNCIYLKSLRLTCCCLRFGSKNAKILKPS